MDSQGKMFGTKVQQPRGDWYLPAVGRVEALLDALRRSLKIADNSPNKNHSRGSYPRFTFGASHGGGQEVRAALRG